MNPILNQLNNGRFSQIQNLTSLAKGNPEGLFNLMLSTNPQFRSFVEQNKGKPPEQIARDYGVDLSQISTLM